MGGGGGKKVPVSDRYQTGKPASVCRRTRGENDLSRCGPCMSGQQCRPLSSSVILSFGQLHVEK